MSFADTIERPGLEAEIALAFSPSATSAFVGKLIVEVDRATAAAVTAAEQARKEALDPTLSKAAQRNARGLMDDAAFSRDRLSAAAAKLRERLAEVKADEENTRRRRDYDKAAAERDEVAEELRSVYPEAAQKLVSLFERLVACDRELGVVNAALPKGAHRIELAEYCAKGDQPILAGGISLFESVTGCVIKPWSPQSTIRWPR